MRRYFVWGTGPATIPEVLEGWGTQDAIETAGEQGFRRDESWIPEDWAVEINTDENLDKQLSTDPNVTGFIVTLDEEPAEETPAD